MEEPVKTYAKMKIFANKTRQSIIEVIAKAGSISFTLLKEELDLTDGRLFFHLKKLDPYLEKDAQKHYRLNEEGKKAYNEIFHTTIDLLTKEEFEEDSNIKFLDKIAPPNIFYYLMGSKTRSLVELGILVLLLSWLFGITGSNFSPIEDLFLGGAVIHTIISILHWLLYFGLIIAIISILRYPYDVLELLIVVLTGILPYFVYLLPLGIAFAINPVIPTWLDIILQIIFIICKIWSTLIIAQGLTITAKVKSYQSIIIASSFILIDYVYLLIIL